MSDETSAPEAPLIDDGAFIEEAQRLRDYLLRVGSIDQSDLIDALMPFEHGAGQPPGERERRALFAAFQAVEARLAGRIDDYTLNEVLNSRSPYEEASHWYDRSARVLRSVGVTVVGIMLVGLAFYFSNWSNRANYLLQEAESFTAFDQFGQMAGLVDLALSFGNGRIVLDERMFDALEQSVDAQKALSVTATGTDTTEAARALSPPHGGGGRFSIRN